MTQPRTSLHTRQLLLDPQDTITATCNECNYSSSLANIALHDCTLGPLNSSTGRCEDYPCCGHTDGDGCQTLASHTSDFYYRNPHLLHEPGSPEWCDALDDSEPYDEDDDDE